MKTGVILLGHGSKLAGASQAMLDLVKQINEQGKWAFVEPAFLQFECPILSESINKLAHAGVEKIVIATFFLLEGNHMQRDIPEQVEHEAKRHKGIQFAYTAALGHHPQMADIVLDRIKEVA